MTDSVYSSIIAYTKSRNQNTDLRVFNDTRYPTHILSIAYTHLLKSKYVPPFNWLKFTGKRLFYTINMFLKLENDIIFKKLDYLMYIDKYYLANLKNQFLYQNITDYTAQFANYDTFKTFQSLWKDVPNTVIAELYKIKKITPALLDFIIDISPFDIKYTRFYISNDVYQFKIKLHPVYQIKSLVRFLTTQCPLEKLEMLDFEFYDSFEKIITVEKTIFHIDHETKYIKNNFFDNNSNSIVDFYSKIDKSVYDNLEIKNIVYFFEFRKLEKKWHNYFIYNKTIKDYDDYLIAKEIHGIKNYNCFFTKNDLLSVNIQIQKYSHNLLDYLCLSQKNVINKVYIRNSLTNEILSKENLDFIDFKPQIRTMETYRSLCNKSIIIESLIAIEAVNFMDLFYDYYKKDLICFVCVLSYFYFQNQICIEQHMEILNKIYYHALEILRTGDTNSINNHIQEFLVVYIISSIFFDAKFLKNIDLLKIIYFIDIRMLEKIEYDDVLDFYNGIEPAIMKMIDVSRFSQKIFGFITESEHRCVLDYLHISDVLDKSEYQKDDYAVYIANIFNYYDSKNIVMKKLVQNKLINEDIKIKDAFISSLLYQNKSIHELINQLYIPIDSDSKYYLPRCWRVYLKRNKIVSLEDIFRKYKSQANIIHCICIATALYNDHKSTTLDYVTNISRNSQVILFYKLLFIFYGLENKYCVDLMDLFDKIFVLCNTPENLFLANLINVLSRNKDNVDSRIIQLAKNIKNDEIDEKYHNLSTVFTNYDDKTENICNLIRKIDIQQCNDYHDSNGIVSYFISNIKYEPRLYVQILKNLNKIPSFELNQIEKYIADYFCIDPIVDLLLKHKNLKAKHNVINLLKTNKQFLRHQKCANLLSKDEIVQLVSDSKTVYPEFFSNLQDINLTFILDNNILYQENHIKIMQAISNKCQITKKHLMNLETRKNAMICMVYRLAMDFDYFGEFIENIKDVNDINTIEVDFSMLNNEIVLREFAERFFISNSDAKYLYIISKIFNCHAYYFDIYFEIYKDVKVLQQLKNSLLEYCNIQ